MILEYPFKRRGIFCKFTVWSKYWANWGVCWWFYVYYVFNGKSAKTHKVYFYLSCDMSLLLAISFMEADTTFFTSCMISNHAFPIIIDPQLPNHHVMYTRSYLVPCEMISESWHSQMHVADWENLKVSHAK